MATYKQKPIRYQTHYPTSDSEEASTSETDWTAFGSSAKTVGRVTNASQNTSDDDWNVLSDTAGLASSGSGFSDIAQEEVIYFPENTSDSHASGLTRLMPSHDGTGNFTSSSLAEALNSVSFGTQSSTSTSLLALPNRWQRGRLFGKVAEFDFEDILTHNTNTVDASSEKENGAMSPLRPSSGSFSSSHKVNQGDVTPVNEYDESVNSDERAPGFSHLPASTNIISEISFIPPDRRQSTSSENSAATTTQEISLYQTPTSRSNEQPRRISLAQLFNLSSSLKANKDNDLGTPEERSPSMMRLMVPSDPMEINFSPTIEGTLNDNRQPQNLSSEPSHPSSDESSLLSTVWTSFRRFASGVINAEFELYNDNSQQASVSLASSYSQHHLSGLASIINGGGENNYTYDACYLPFGNHLTLSGIGSNERGSLSSRYNSKYQYSPFSKSSKNHRPSILTPASSSTSLTSFFSRSGSDCGLEIGRDMASNIQFGNKCK